MDARIVRAGAEEASDYGPPEADAIETGNPLQAESQRVFLIPARLARSFRGSSSLKSGRRIVRTQWQDYWQENSSRERERSGERGGDRSRAVGSEI